MLSRADKLHAERCERSVQRHMDTDRAEKK